MATKNKDRAELDNAMAILSDKAEEARILFQKARYAYFSNNTLTGKSWKDARKIELQVGHFYFIRRIWRGANQRRLRAEAPVLSQWTTNGWEDQFRHLDAATSTNAGLEIWHA